MQDTATERRRGIRHGAGVEGHQGARPHPVRGGPVLHRSAGMARRRRRQGGRAQSRRAGALGVQRPCRRQLAYFIYYNLNKRSITCNLKSDEGKALLTRMIEQADVLIENMAPGTFARLGFDYPRLSEINPRLIFAQVKGFAPESPHANYLCFDMIAQAMGGTMGVNGHPDGPRSGRARRSAIPAPACCAPWASSPPSISAWRPAGPAHPDRDA